MTFLPARGAQLWTELLRLRVRLNDRSPQMQRYRRAAFSTVGLVVAKVFSALSTIIAVRLTLQYLGAERYGLWMTISSAVALLGFANFGVGNSIVTLVAEAGAGEDNERIRGYVSSGAVVLCITTAILLVGFAIVAPLISWDTLFHVETALAAREAYTGTFVMAVAFAINIPLNLIQNVEVGLQRGYVASIWQSLGSLVTLAGVIVCAAQRAGLPWLVLAAAGGPAVVNLAAWIWELAQGRAWIIPSPRSIDWGVTRTLLVTGGYFFVLQMLGLIGASTDNLIIANRLGSSAVAGFSVVQKLFFMGLLAQFIAVPFWPAFSEALAAHDYVWARRALQRILLLCVSAGAVVAAVLVLAGRWIVTLWAGREYAPSLMLLLGFAGWLVVASYGSVMSVFLNTRQLLRKQVLFFTLAAVSSVAIKFAVVERFGGTGVIWGTVVGYGVFYVAPAWVAARRSLAASDGVLAEDGV
jgi:O-antigen/teichoic acid export membrane protein